MEVTYRTKNNRLSFKLDAADQKGVFEQLASVQDVFEAASVCGCCGSDNIRFRVRRSKDSTGKKDLKYYELRCMACYAQLSFGQHQIGDTLFPKRKNEDGSYMDKDGWFKYQPKGDAYEG